MHRGANYDDDLKFCRPTSSSGDAERMDWKHELYRKVALFMAPTRSRHGRLLIFKSPKVDGPASVCGGLLQPAVHAPIELIAAPDTDPRSSTGSNLMTTTSAGWRGTLNFIANRIAPRHVQIVARQRRPAGLRRGDDRTGEARPRESGRSARQIWSASTIGHVMKTWDNLKDDPLRAMAARPRPSRPAISAGFYRGRRAAALDPDRANMPAGAGRRTVSILKD